MINLYMKMVEEIKHVKIKIQINEIKKEKYLTHKLSIFN